MKNQVDESKLYRCTVEVGPSVRMTVGRFPVTGPATHSTPQPISGGELLTLIAKQAANESQLSGRLLQSRLVRVSNIREAV